jgi:dTDP-4-dehydrorhamnose reductase
LKVLILGAAGTLGHKLYQILSKTFDTAGTIRGLYENLSRFGFFRQSDIIPYIDAMYVSQVEKAIDSTKPDVVINCIGIIKAIEESHSKLKNIWLNALLPHQLNEICQERSIRLIHISTDCVFSGNKGDYLENDLSDAEDIYGKTKFLGEINQSNCVTIRTSFIGRELSTSHNLVEWFLSNQGGSVKGYTNAIFSGFPTVCLAQIIKFIIETRNNLHGIYHVSSEPISKYELLKLIRDRLNVNIEIEKFSDYQCNRSLNSTLFMQATGFKPQSWSQMIDKFAVDSQQYSHWRKNDI